MQCVTPMFRRYEMGNHSKGQIVPRNEVLDCLDYDPNHIRNCLDKVNAHNRKLSKGYLYEQVPCQHCWACKLNYAAQWATRIMLECSRHEHNYFITFTYDDEHLPIPEKTEYNGITYENDGTWMGSLYPDDIRKFINSFRRYMLREKNHTGIKFFYAGEYGSTTQRPHYHMILMNCPLDINQFYDCFEDTNFKLHWKSHEIEKYWDKGIIDIGEVEFASAAYVARYCMKKITDDTDKTIYWSQGKHPEFVRMSRRPGIGSEYFEEHYQAMYKNDELIFKNFHGETITVKPPKAWDKKMKELHPDWWFKISQSRKRCADRSRKLIQEMTDMTDIQMLEMKAEDILRKGKMLPREL